LEAKIQLETQDHKEKSMNTQLFAVELGIISIRIEIEICLNQDFGHLKMIEIHMDDVLINSSPKIVGYMNE